MNDPTEPEQQSIHDQYLAWISDGFNEEQAFLLALETWKSALISYRTSPATRKPRR